MLSLRLRCPSWPALALREQCLNVGLYVVFVHQPCHISRRNPSVSVYEECVWHALNAVPLGCRIVSEQHLIGSRESSQETALERSSHLRPETRPQRRSVWCRTSAGIQRTTEFPVWHPVHQVAQKSNSTTLPRYCSSFAVLPTASRRAKSAAGLRSGSGRRGTRRLDCAEAIVTPQPG